MNGQPMRPRNIGGCPCPDCHNDRPSTERVVQKREWHAEANRAVRERSSDTDGGAA